MTAVRVSLVDVYPVRVWHGSLQLLLLRRAPGGRCPGSHEAVHGHIEAGEPPAEAARRELREETGLSPLRLYNLSRVELFYQAAPDEVALVPVFVAVIADGADVVRSVEHDASEWVDFSEARRRLTWPRSARALDDIERLLPGGEAGPVTDVLLLS
ncbi:MAG TPA: NUDIX domain-containing protein [Gemmatimonadales bacterium]|nr:NUDIX domain-containing protein [Gemmatimonadales bacterium]